MPLATVSSAKGRNKGACHRAVFYPSLSLPFSLSFSLSLPLYLSLPLRRYPLTLNLTRFPFAPRPSHPRLRRFLFIHARVLITGSRTG